MLPRPTRVPGDLLPGLSGLLETVISRHPAVPGFLLVPGAGKLSIRCQYQPLEILSFLLILPSQIFLCFFEKALLDIFWYYVLWERIGSLLKVKY